MLNSFYRIEYDVKMKFEINKKYNLQLMSHKTKTKFQQKLYEIYLWSFFDLNLKLILMEISYSYE